MPLPDTYLVTLSPRAEPDLLRLPAPVRRRLRSVMDGIAEVASLIPPVNPQWMRLPGQRLPVLRVHVMGVELSYIVDSRERTIRILAVAELATESSPRAA